MLRFLIRSVVVVAPPWVYGVAASGSGKARARALRRSQLHGRVRALWKAVYQYRSEEKHMNNILGLWYESTISYPSP
jgi:hypothetical protein